MTPSKRSTLQLDLKDISSRSTGPNISRISLVACSVLVVGIAVASMNIPSEDIAAENIINETDAAVAAATGAKDKNTEATDNQKSEAQPAEVAKELSSTETPGDSDQHENSKPASSGFNTKIVADTAATEPAPVADTKPVKPALITKPIQLASLAPIPSVRIKQPVVNQVEADPAASSEIMPLPLSVTINADKNSDGEQPESIQLANAAPLANIESTVLSSQEEQQSDDAILAPDANTEEPIDTAPQRQWLSETVKKKDTLSQIFNRLGLSSREAYKLVKLEQSRPLTKIRPGQKFEVAKREDEEGNVKLAALRLKLNRFDTLVIEHDASLEDGYRIDTETREPEIRVATSSATISGSLLGAAKRAGIPYDTVYELATIFGWQVDFSKDIQKGDRFTVVHEELYLDDVKVGDGAVIATELTTGNKKLQAVRHVDEHNHVNYFAPNGDGIQGSFLRSPIKFARVSSKFSKKRFHPIQKKWKAHKGVDYSAPMKTPIRATGDGVVKFAGRKKGYGKTVILKHGGKYETLYAHMNHFKKGVNNGSRVQQGDVIGYVGKTGWTTGPHLHYEFRVRGKHMNPLTVELPKSAPIADRYLAEFRKDANRMVAVLSGRETFKLVRNP